MLTFSPGTDGAQTGETLISGFSGRIVIPDAASLFQGTYSRQASDLVIEGPGGNVIRVADYYHADVTAALYSETGAVVSADVVGRLVGPQNPMVFAQAGTPAGQPQIGQVETLEGSAFATRANGQRVALAIGDPVFADDLVETANDSKLGLTLIDETVFSLSADARMILDELVYEPGGANNAMLVNLVQGTFVFITGQIAPTGDMRVETPVATVGIRGTTPIMIIEGQDGNTVFGILQDPDGTVGQYAIYDKLTGQVIERIVDEGMIVQLDRVGGDPTPVTIDAAGLAARAEAQSSAYFLYSTARSRIDSRPQNDQPGDGNQDDGTGQATGDHTQNHEGQGPDTFSSGLKGFQFALGEGGLNTNPPGPPIHPYQSGAGSNPARGDGPHTFIDANVAPIVEDLLFLFSEDASIAKGAFAAIDPDGGSAGLKFHITQQPEFGAVVINNDGTFTFIGDPIFDTLAPGEVASVSFTYRAVDSRGGVSNSATVTLQIHGENDAPVAKPIVIQTTDEDGHTFSFDLLSTAYDPDHGDNLDTANVTATATSGAHSVLFSVDNQTGQLSFDPRQFNSLAVGDFVTVRFDYTIVDSSGATRANTAHLTINGRNDNPIAVDDGKSGEYKVASGDSLTILVSELLANDSDPDNGDSFDLTSVFNSTNGTATLNSGANPSVTINTNSSLSDGTVVGFQYQITDNSGASGFASVDIIIDNMVA